MKKWFYIVLLALLPLSGNSQQHISDSLYQIAVSAKSNYDKAINYNLSSHSLMGVNPDSSLVIAQLGLKYAEKTKIDTVIADQYLLIGLLYKKMGNFTESVQSYSNAIKYAKKAKSIAYVDEANKALGVTYNMQGNYSLAIKIFYELLFKAKTQKDTMSIAQNLTNLANSYFYQSLNDKAIELYKEAYHYAVLMKSEFGQSLLLSNIGSVYFAQKDYKSSMEYYEKSIEIAKRIEDLEGVALNYSNMGSIYFILEEFDKAFEIQLKSLEVKKQLNDSYGKAVSLNELGKISHEKGNIPKGILFSTEALQMAQKIGAVDLERSSHHSIYLMYEALGKDSKALFHYKKYIELKDSIFNEENKKKDIRNELNFQYQRQHFTDSIEHVKSIEIERQNVEKAQIKVNAQKKLTVFFIIAFIVMLILSGFIYKEFREKKKSHEIIQLQKAEVEQKNQTILEKNREITDSINYAKRIQEAILPSRYSLTEHLKNGFVLYKPKDIVSGDFYWLEKYNNDIYFAAADCTGHGVPGAMVSVVCANALSKALLEENITETGKLLDRTRSLVIEKFTKNNENVKDGMDISLCKISDRKLQWSGANNPLWIIKKDGTQVDEIKPNKQPIGMADNLRPFDSHQVALNQGDSIYVFTDGFADQFGGEKGKKFMYKPLKELLLSIQQLNMNEQREKLNDAFVSWKGTNEQVDDVCIIGVRIE